MLKESIEALTNYLKVFVKNPLRSLVGMLAIFLVVFAVVNTQKMNEIIRHQPSAHKESVLFTKSIMASQEVNKAIENVRQKLHADTVVVRQFHNGVADLTGIPFTSIKTTHIALGKGLGLPDSGFQSVPISIMTSSLSKMWPSIEKPTCFIGYTKDIPDPIYKLYFVNQGVVKFAECPMTNLLNYPVGYIGIGYMKDDKSIPDSLILNETSKLSTKIVGFLGAINAEDEGKKILGIF